ncbi:hypothetical protein FACS1894188_11500 [Clostridia bacterium]|nr:hypothetical protein FACS1894188_11500 [Clostridia bacterium]
MSAQTSSCDLYGDNPTIAAASEPPVAEIIDYFNKKKESVLIYCDPPYVGTEDYYIKYYKADSDTLFTESEHLRLANALKNSSKNWILGYNDCEFVRETYRDFNIKAVERANNMSNGAGTKKNKYKELIITNY